MNIGVPLHNFMAFRDLWQVRNELQTLQSALGQASLGSPQGFFNSVQTCSVLCTFLPSSNPPSSRMYKRDSTRRSCKGGMLWQGMSGCANRVC